MSFIRRPVPLTAPSLDEVRIRNLVDELAEAWRHEPTGVPRRPRSFDRAYILRRLGRSGGQLTAEEYALVERLWAESRRRRGVGGAVGVTTFSSLPDAADSALEQFDRRYALFMKGGARWSR